MMSAVVGLRGLHTTGHYSQSISTLVDVELCIIQIRDPVITIKCLYAAVWAMRMSLSTPTVIGQPEENCTY